MLLNTSNYYQSGIPPQQIPLKEKLKDKDAWGYSKWQKDCMNAFEAIGRQQFYRNLRLKTNYEIVSGEFKIEHYIDRTDFYDSASAYAQELNIPNYLQHYDITARGLNVLEGEFLKKPFLFKVRAYDEDSVNEMVEAKTEMLQGYFKAKIQQGVLNKIRATGFDPDVTEFQNEEEQQAYEEQLAQLQQQFTPEGIEKYFRYDFQTSAEKWGNFVINFDRQRFNLKELDRIQFRDMLIVDRAFRHFYLTPTGYNIEWWNPIETFYQLSPNLRYIEDGDYVGRIGYMTKSQVLDRFGWKMHEEQQKALYPYHKKDGSDDSTVLGEFFKATLMPWDGFRDYANQVSITGSDPYTGRPLSNIQSLDLILNQDTNPYNLSEYVLVTEVYWKSQHRIGKLNYIDHETGEVVSTLVDETFQPKLFGIKEVKVKEDVNTKEPNTIVWSWKTQTWKGIKINANHSNETLHGYDGIYLDMEPCEFEFRSDYDIYRSKLPVCGQIFSNINSRSSSYVDLMKPYQIFVNSLMNDAYAINQREVGKAILMDVNLIPSLKDWGGEENYEKFVSIMKALQIAPIDSRPSNKQGSNFQHFTVLDATESDRIAAKINLVILVEQMAYRQIGITDQRMGQVQASETATGTTQAINNSYAQTESYFHKFADFMRRCLQMELDIAHYVGSEQKKDFTLNYTMDDMSRAMIETSPANILNRNLGVLVEDSQETQRNLEIAKQLALNNNTTNLPMSALLKMSTLNSLREIEVALKQAEDDFNKQQQQAQESAERQIQMKLEAEAAEKQADRELKKYEVDTKANTELQRATLQGIANESSFNTELDLTDKLIAQKDIALREHQINSQNYTAQQQLVNQQIDSIRKSKLEEKKMLSDKQLKEQEAKHKKDIENQKLTQIKEQSRNQELMQKKKIESDEKLLKLKGTLEKEKAEKQLEIKQLEKKMKEMEIANVKAKSNVEINHLKKKIELEEDLAETKASAIEKITEVKAKEATKISEINIAQKKKESQIKVDLSKKLAAKKAKENPNK